MTNIQKNEILQLIESEKVRLGDYVSVAKKCGISETAISQLRSGKYGAKGDDIYHKIALALGYSFDNSNWNIVTNTTDFRTATETLDDAKKRSMFMVISSNAGSGKTTAADAYLMQNKTNGVFKLTCKEWSAREFLQKLLHELGSDTPTRYASVNTMIDNVEECVKRIGHLKPLLIIDQANSLKPAALRTLIHVSNGCHRILGILLLGTENLREELQRGVRLNRKGYDEVESRFTRRYINLIGATLSDTRKICEANGITNKILQDDIFKNSFPTRIALEYGENKGKMIYVVKDKRMIERGIIREQLKLKSNVY